MKNGEIEFTFPTAGRELLPYSPQGKLTEQISLDISIPRDFLGKLLSPYFPSHNGQNYYSCFCSSSYLLSLVSCSSCIVLPEYPEIARKAGIERTMLLYLLINENGNVVKAYVAISVETSLDQAALEAAKKTIFYPALQRDKPVAV